MLRRQRSRWQPIRSSDLLKVKKLQDMEGVVTGFTWGRRTELGSRHLGRMGALVLKLENGRRLELSGFTDEEREVEEKGTREMLDFVCVEAEANEGKDASSFYQPRHFPVGSVVTFKYRELSDDGVPKEARYWRKHG